MKTPVQVRFLPIKDKGYIEKTEGFLFLCLRAEMTPRRGKSNSMTIKLTENAAIEVKKFIEEGDSDDAHYLRVAVMGGGCSGFQYGLPIDSAYDEEKDTLYEQHGIKIIVDKNLLYI